MCATAVWHVLTDSQSVYRRMSRTNKEFQSVAKLLKELNELQDYVNQSLVQSDNMAQIISVEKKLVTKEVREMRVRRREGEWEHDEEKDWNGSAGGDNGCADGELCRVKRYR